MKRWIILPLFISFFLWGGAQKEVNKEETTSLMQMAIEAKMYTIDVSQAIPQRGTPITLQYGYNLKLNRDTVVSFLPYFGKAYSMPYGRDEGMKFTGLVEKYTVKYSKKGNADISFEVKTRDDRFRFFITVSSGGMSGISISSNRRSTILYTGEFVMPR